MDRSVKDPDNTRFELLLGVGLGTAMSAGLVSSIAIHLADAATGSRQHCPWNPLSTALGLAHGTVTWTTGATVATAGLLIMAGVAAWVVRRWWRRLRPARRARLAIDSQARWMGRGEGIAALTEQAVRAKAADLRIALPEGAAPGIPIGRSVHDGCDLFGSYEDLHVDIWAPRQGKTTARVIPAIMAAPGAVVTTSNKRDVVDATRDHRATKGRVWVFDPQSVAEEPCTWFWDPLAWVRGDGRPGTEVRAAELAGHFAAADAEDAKTDAFFDPEGEDLAAALILAAAIDNRPIVDVYRWVCREGNPEPVKLLGKAGYEMAAAGLSAQYQAAEKQRSGVFGTAKKMLRCLKIQATLPWVTPPIGSESRVEFEASTFVTGTDTLYSLSLEGAGAAGPLVTALASAVCGAGVDRATRSPGGRLPLPMLAVLDEAANIVKWRDLPKLYSHFGSRGIVVMTVLQSWAQGVRCWGRDGMDALWSAANIKVLGSGLDDAGFLRDRSEIVGEHYEHQSSVSASQGGRSTSTSRTATRTLTVSDLAAMPRGRAVVFAAGVRPVLVRTIPWMDRPYAAIVRESLAAHDPADTTTARRDLRLVPEIEDENAA